MTTLDWIVAKWVTSLIYFVGLLVMVSWQFGHEPEPGRAREVALMVVILAIVSQIADFLAWRLRQQELENRIKSEMSGR